MALNRNNQGDRAEQLLRDLIAQFGPHPEPWGLLGRVYKDRWEAAQEYNTPDRAEAMLAEAILVSLEGYDADPREAYPAINAATLMTVARLHDSPQYQELLSLLERTIDYRAQMLVQDYFDYATRAEFAVLKDNERAAHEHVTQALDVVRESWEPLTTARNIRLIREAKERYGQPVSWIMSLEERLGEIRPSGHVGLSVAGA